MAAQDHIEPAGTYKSQYHLRWRGGARLLDPFPRLKEWLASSARGLLKQIFEPGMVTTERVIEYPFVFQHLNGVVGPVLDLVTRVPGVRAAMLVSGDDGLVVAEQLMEGVKGGAVAALVGRHDRVLADKLAHAYLFYGPQILWVNN